MRRTRIESWEIGNAREERFSAKGGGWNRLFRSRGFGFYDYGGPPGLSLSSVFLSSSLSSRYPPPCPSLSLAPFAYTSRATQPRAREVLLSLARSLAHHPSPRKSMRTARPFLNPVTHDWNTPWYPCLVQTDETFTEILGSTSVRRQWRTLATWCVETTNLETRSILRKYLVLPLIGATVANIKSRRI